MFMLSIPKLEVRVVLMVQAAGYWFFFKTLYVAPSLLRERWFLVIYAAGGAHEADFPIALVCKPPWITKAEQKERMKLVSYKNEWFHFLPGKSKSEK